MRDDGLILVTLPATSPAISDGGEIYLDTHAFCYLVPETMNAYVSKLGYVAMGADVSFEFDKWFAAAEPIDSMLD